ncbi:MAG TPA: acyl-CoA dehydrogenase family protein [Rectinemataceae bacterium]|nr:acyl-CoA dehydrogenase family protein [Rectinemataceae bacterium]
MAENFYLDNPDLRLRMESADLAEIVDLKEKGYSSAAKYRNAPRNYRDAQDNWRLVLEILGDICANVIAPMAPAADEEGATFHGGEVSYSKATDAAIEAFRKSEILGAMLPWEYGGMNLPETVYQAMVEMVSRAEGGLMTIFGLQEIASTINEFGDEEMKARILPRFSRGEVFGAMVLTEPDAGSDLGAVQTRATLDEKTGTWKINGVKRFITNGNAHIHLVLARSEEGTKDARGLSMFLVERDRTVKIRRIENKLGIHSSPTCELQYTDTPAILVGKRRFGLMRCAMALMNGARLAVAAQARGISEAAYREALRYAGERLQFGKPVSELPAVSRMLVSMKGEIEAARALIFETSCQVDALKAFEAKQEELAAAGLPADPAVVAKKKRASNLADMLTPMSKYYATEMGNRVCYKAMQIHGGVGYMKEFNAERHYRDVRITNIYEGTSQLQVVAAIGKMVGRGLDVLLDEWAGLEYPAELASLKAALEETTSNFRKCCDALKDKDREVIDYFGADLVEMGAVVVNSWLLLRDAIAVPRKRELVRAYAAEHLPRASGLGAAILAGDMSSSASREAILA